MKIKEIKNMAGLEDLITKVSSWLVSFSFIKPKLQQILDDINAGTFNPEKLKEIKYPESLQGSHRQVAEYFMESLFSYLNPF